MPLGTAVQVENKNVSKQTCKLLFLDYPDYTTLLYLKNICSKEIEKKRKEKEQTYKTKTELKCLTRVKQNKTPT